MESNDFSRGRAPSPFFRYRPLGRAPSPPTWACYEQIHAPPYDSDSDSDVSFDMPSDHDDDDHSDSEDEEEQPVCIGGGNDAAAVDSMDLNNEADRIKDKGKGKARAVDSTKTRERERKEHRRRQPVIALRPILTIQRSQGFVWNQDLFVPPYIKDRYVASTSPPNSTGFISNPSLTSHSGMPDYEVEVVEIRVREDELLDIIP